MLGWRPEAVLAMMYTGTVGNRDNYIEAVSKLKSFFATSRGSKETLLSFAKDSSNEEVHESRDQ